MALKKILQRGSDYVWRPDADPYNAPENSLLRADNLVTDEVGAISLRRGSETIWDDLNGSDQATGVHTIYSVLLPNPDPDGTRYDVAASGEKVYINGVDQGVALDGAVTDDMTVGDDAYQIFMARGNTKLKFDGTDINNWAIAPPAKAVTLSAASILSQTIWTFASGETPGTITTHEGSGVYAAGYDGTGSAAMEFTPSATSGIASVSKLYSSDQNYYDIMGALGGQTDLLDFYVWLSAPSKCNKITVMFGMGTGSDPFIDDYYYFDFLVRDSPTVDIKDPFSYGAAAYGKAVELSQQALTPEDVTNIKSPDQVKDVLARLGRTVGSTSVPRADTQQSSPAWTHFTVTRGQFSRVGNTTARDWRTIRAIKLVYTATPGSTEVVRFDDMVFIGGGDRVLNGTFRCVWRAARNTGKYIELSPVSPVSQPIVLKQQALVISFPATAVSGLDDQVNEIWVYLFGGFLDTWYRFEVIGAQNNSSISLNEFDPSADGTVDAADQRRGMVLEMGWPGFTPPGDLILTIRKSELEAVIENETLEPGAVSIPDNITAIAGPWLNRMFLVTDEGYVYPTSQTSPSNCSVYHVMDARRYGDPMWAVQTNGGVFIGLTKDIVRVVGTGDESTDHASVDLHLEPMNMGSPPVDRTHFTDGATIVYRSADGLMVFNGATAAPVNKGATSLLWVGYPRHGVAALNTTTGRFRVAVDQQRLYMLAPEGEDVNPDSLWRCTPATGKWSRFVYPEQLLSIFRDSSGRILVGTVSGKILEIETGIQDSGANITPYLLTPWEDDGDSVTRKAPFDIQLQCFTGGLTGTLTIHTDSDPTTAYAYPFATNSNTAYRIDVSSLPRFIANQYEITGNFAQFVLQNFGVTYSPMVQHMMAVDTGYIIPGDPGILGWMESLEVDCVSPTDLLADIYIDDVLYTSQPVVIQANRRSVYPVPLPRGTKGRRPRIILRNPTGVGEGEVGFECFGVRIKMAGSGNAIELALQNTTIGG